MVTGPVTAVTPPQETGMRIVTLANEKGGVGKTTLAFHLAHFAAESAFRVLVIDADPQDANITYLFTGEQVPGTFDVLVKERPVAQVAHPLRTDGRLWLVGSDRQTGAARAFLFTQGSPLDVLVGPLAAVQSTFDLVVIDTSPSPAMKNGRVVDALNAAALFASHFVLSPVIPEQLSMVGLASLSETLTLLRQRGSEVALLGIAPVKYDARTNEHAHQLRELANVYGRHVYPVTSQAIAVAESTAYGVPVWQFAPRNPVAAQLRQVTERILHDVFAR